MCVVEETACVTGNSEGEEEGGKGETQEMEKGRFLFFMQATPLL